MPKYEVILELEIEEGNPRKWNWSELLDLNSNETVWVDSKELIEGEGK